MTGFDPAATLLEGEDHYDRGGGHRVVAAESSVQARVRRERPAPDLAAQQLPETAKC